MHMRCPSCGHENQPTARFCDQCATELGQTCASCHTQNEPGARFCRQCREPLGSGASTSSHTPIPPSTQPLPSSFASGRYQVRRFLGEGAKKRVYVAHDTKLDREVAFALIKTEGLDADGIVRVRREAQAMGRLGDHPHTVTIYDTGDEHGAPYIVAQYMSGGSVEDLLAKADQHRVVADRAMQIAAQVCDGLAHAHARGIIHRDLKPGNVWLDAEGNAALGDFGLAFSIDRSRLTMQGMMVGTVAYMAPEQALGRAPDARSDLYSLGALLYEMITAARRSSATTPSASSPSTSTRHRSRPHGTARNVPGRSRH
jgi:serine/threonine protein kinase